MMCVRVLMGAFVFYNDAWSPAPLGAALFVASLQRPEPVTFHLPNCSQAGPTAEDLTAPRCVKHMHFSRHGESFFCTPKKSDWMCRWRYQSRSAPRGDAVIIGALLY